MKKEKKLIKFTANTELEDSEELRAELASAMVENKRVKRLIDLFLLALFLLLITYTTF